MKRIVLLLFLVLTGSVVAQAEDSLLVRYAFLIGGRGAGDAPPSAGVLSQEELTKFLIDWDPDSDNAEVRRVFALNHLGEVARQAVQLPLEGGQVQGVYPYGKSSYEVRLHVEPAKDGTVMVSAQMLRDGQLFAAPQVRQAMGERAIISSSHDSENLFIFLVLEVDRVSAEALRQPLQLPWRREIRTVDGETIRPPRILKQVAPVYTPEAKEAGIAGTVILRLVVDRTGSVRDVQVVKGLPKGLTNAAIDAVRQWKFEPSRVDGKPVDVYYTLTVNFVPD